MTRSRPWFRIELVYPDGSARVTEMPVENDDCLAGELHRASLLWLNNSVGNAESLKPQRPASCSA